jgi:transketolase
VVKTPENPQRLIPAYSKALLEQARNNPKIICLDADLILDTGLIPFKDEFPKRFVECGIAEQDMVSQAGGMAIRGLLPIVHSFACFLSARPNEQIYNNATEKTKIIYVGSLAGVLPGGPGHSHQAVRDISTLSAIPGIVLMEPSSESEVGMLLDWAVNVNKTSSYLRMVSIPFNVPFKLPLNYRPELGKGITLTDGQDAAIISYGPIMLSQAYNASKRLKEESGINIKVINLPWLNAIDNKWIINEIGNCKNIILLDNHYLNGGQGSFLMSNIDPTFFSNKKFSRLGIREIPLSGTNDQVLEQYNLSEDSIVRLIQDMLS